MHPEAKKPNLLPLRNNNFEYFVKRYAEYGRDLGHDLDTWADQSTDRLKAHGIVYPANGSIKEKWDALSGIFSENKLYGLLAKIRNHIVILQEALENGVEAYKTALKAQQYIDLDEWEQTLTAEEIDKPYLRPLINEVRESIQSLRRFL